MLEWNYLAVQCPRERDSQFAALRCSGWDSQDHVRLIPVCLIFWASQFQLYLQALLLLDLRLPESKLSLRPPVSSHKSLGAALCTGRWGQLQLETIR